MIHFEVYFD